MTGRLAVFARRADWPLNGAALLLIGTGLVAIWSFSTPHSWLFGRQLIWMGLGMAAFLATALTDYRLFRNHGAFLVALYVLVLALLGALLLFAPATRGIHAWFRLGGASLQPVEPAKLVLALVLAKYFSRRHVEIARPVHLLISGLYAGLAVLLVLLQPDLGSAIILGAVWLTVVLSSGIRWRHLAAFFIAVAAVAVFSWSALLAPYQQDRIRAFIDPYRDPRGAGYSTIQAIVAVGSGQLTGRGIGYGTQSHLNFLPEAETDFVFAAFAEETGLIGATLLLGFLAVFFWRILHVGALAEDNFAKLYTVGFTSFLASAAAIHIGMNLGLLPVTGIGLPFISYGGSSLVTMLAGLGIVQSIRIHSRAEIE